MFVSYSRHIQAYFHQGWAQSAQNKIWPVLDIGWPWPILFLLFVSYSRHVQVSCHQVWAQSEQVEIWPDLWPWGFLTLGASDPLTISPYLTLGAFDPLTNVNLLFLGPSYTLLPNFRSVGITISENKDGQTNMCIGLLQLPPLHLWNGTLWCKDGPCGFDL